MSDEVIETSEMPDMEAQIEAPVEAVVEEIPQEESKPAEPSYSDIELQAMEMGWLPKTKFKGDESDWKGAKAFVKDKEVFDTIHSLKRKLKTQNEALKTMYSLAKSDMEKKSTDTISSLKAQIKEATANFDSDRVEKLTDELIELSKKQQTVELPKLEDEEDPVISQQDAINTFVKQHSWMSGKTIEEIEAQQMALEELPKIVKLRPDLSPTDHLQIVAGKVKKQFPSLFQQEKPKPVASPVESGITESGSSSKNSYLYGKIPGHYKDAVNYMKINMPGFDIKEFYDLLKSRGEI